jgi:hypothetical protein
MTDKVLPEFDENGNLPLGCYKPTFKEFEERFVESFPNSISRKLIFQDYSDFSILLCEEMPSAKKQILNGSFTTNKENPEDMDLLIVFDGESLTSFEKSKCPLLMNNETIKEGYNCHSFPLVKFPKSKPKLYESYLAKKKYWLECWGSDREDNLKGLINIPMNKSTFNGAKNET